MEQQPKQRSGMSIGSAIVLSIAGIIMAVIIAAAIIFASGAKTIRDLGIDIDDFDGLEIQVDENGEKTNINVDVNKPIIEVDVPSSVLLQECPDELIYNKMPSIEPDTMVRSYYILNGERYEIAEFDEDWVRQNCTIPVLEVF